MIRSSYRADRSFINLKRKACISGYRSLLIMLAFLYASHGHAALLVSEREIEIESEKAWEQMKTSLPISRDLSKRTKSIV